MIVKSVLEIEKIIEGTAIKIFDAQVCPYGKELDMEGYMMAQVNVLDLDFSLPLTFRIDDSSNGEPMTLVSIDGGANIKNIDGLWDAIEAACAELVRVNQYDLQIHGLVSAQFGWEQLDEKVSFSGVYDVNDSSSVGLCPYFTKEEAEKIAAYMDDTSDSERLFYAADENAFILESRDSSDSEDSVTHGANKISGVDMYAIGACSWTWELRSGYPLDWVSTDSTQFVKQHSEDRFEFVELLSLNDGLNDEVYVINHGVIDYQDYSEEQILQYTKSYGYETIAFLQGTYGEDWKLIACECLFESLNEFRYFSSLKELDCIEILKNDFGLEVEVGMV